MEVRHPYQDDKLPVDKRAADLLARMTLTEKVGQLNQRLYGFSCYERNGDTITLTQQFMDEVKLWGGIGTLYGLYRADPWSKRGHSDGIPPRLASKAYNTAQRYVLENSRLSIPMLLSSEAPHGHQALEGYLLPVGLAMGATFNPPLARSAYEVCGAQMKGLGVDLALISVLDVLRDPRWGRSEECFGEDPFLCARFAEAAVLGCQSQGVGVIAKHFCAQGECTGGINASAARIGERELREIHLPAAEACCEAGVCGIMAAYNEIDGLPCHANKWLLTDVLRDEMGFRGVVMADGAAIDRLDSMTGDSVRSGALALKSGIDISLWDNGFAGLVQAVEMGCVSESRLDESVLRVLRLKLSRGLFEHPFLECADESGATHFGRQSITTAQINVRSGPPPPQLELARQSVVLLKNKDNLLPLSRGKLSSIAVIGPNADNIYNQVGDYSPPLADGGVTLIDAVQKLAGNDIRVEYAFGCGLFSRTQTDRDEIAKARETALGCDAVILALGGSSSRFDEVQFHDNGAVAAGFGGSTLDCGEGLDCASLELGGFQEELSRVVFETGKPVITVLIAGRPYAAERISNQSDALLYAFYPGVLGGQALAEIILGDCEPSGRLPVSIPRHAGQLPVYYNSKNSYNAMGYCDVENSPLYSFGDGMGYTSFEYCEAKLSDTVISVSDLSRGKTVTLSLNIVNTGNRGGFAVPQLYIRALNGSVVRRRKELKAFDKVFINAKNSVGVSLTLDWKSLSIWNNQMRRVVEPGRVELLLCDQGETLWKETLVLAE